MNVHTVQCANHTKFQPSDLFGDPIRFERLKQTRNIPFAYIGQKVVFHSSGGDRIGIICGANSSSNLDILFDGTTWLANCHPHYMMDYYGADGEIVASYR